MVCGTYQAPLMGACPRCLGIKAEDTGKFKEGTRKGNPLASFCFSVSGIKEQSKYWNSHTLTWQTQKSVYGSVKSGLFIWEIGGFLYKSEIGGLERGANCWGGRVFSVCGGMSAPPLRSEYAEASEGATALPPSMMLLRNHSPPSSLSFFPFLSGMTNFDC